MAQPAQTTTALTTAKMPQKHGGALNRGGTRGNKGGAARHTPNAIREKLRGIVHSRPQFLAEVIDGKPLQRISFLLSDLLPHATCPNCGELGLAAQKPEEADRVEIEVLTSAAVKERIQAWDVAAKYGVGVLKEISTETVRERLIQTLETIRAQLPAEEAERVITALRGVWS